MGSRASCQRSTPFTSGFSILAESELSESLIASAIAIGSEKVCDGSEKVPFFKIKSSGLSSSHSSRFVFVYLLHNILCSRYPKPSETDEKLLDVVCPSERQSIIFFHKSPNKSHDYTLRRPPSTASGNGHVAGYQAGKCIRDSARLQHDKESVDDAPKSRFQALGVSGFGKRGTARNCSQYGRRRPDLCGRPDGIPHQRKQGQSHCGIDLWGAPIGLCFVDFEIVRNEKHNWKYTGIFRLWNAGIRHGKKVFGVQKVHAGGPVGIPERDCLLLQSDRSQDSSKEEERGFDLVS